MAGIIGVLQQKCSLFPYPVKFLKINTFGFWSVVAAGLFFSEEQSCQWEEPDFPCFNFTIFELQETHNHWEIGWLRTIAQFFMFCYYKE